MGVEAFATADHGPVTEVAVSNLPPPFQATFKAIRVSLHGQKNGWHFRDSSRRDAKALMLSRTFQDGTDSRLRIGQPANGVFPTIPLQGDGSYPALPDQAPPLPCIPGLIERVVEACWRTCGPTSVVSPASTRLTASEFAEVEGRLAEDSQ